jgi:integrase
MKGIRRHGTGWQAEVRVTGHPRSVRQFPISATSDAMQDWRKDEKARLRLTAPRATKGTFASDARRYLALVKTMPSFTSRKRDIELWIEVFGTRPRSSITRADIRAQRDTWHLHGPRRVWQKHPDGRRGGQWIDVPSPLAASTINHRLRALANLWTELDGRHAPNPAREVPELEEDDSIDRSLPYQLIEMIVEAMPDRGKPTKGASRPSVSLTKIRARVMAYVGLPPVDIGRLTPQRIDLDAGWVDTGKRRKGKGVLTGRRPLTAQGAAALQAFVSANAFGPFSTSSMRQSIRRACRTVALRLGKNPETADLAAIVARIRPYDFRHSYVTEVLDKSGDLLATQLLSGHADLRTTIRYAKRAVNPVMRAALNKVTASGGFAAPVDRASTPNG